jgi:uncharacterized beta barrel domain-containing protein DUF5777
MFMAAKRARHSNLIGTTAALALPDPASMQKWQKAVWSMRHILAALVAVALSASIARAQGTPPPQPAQASDPDVRLDPLQPDFTLAALPTALRLPENKLAFRVTHRFLRALNQGDAGDLFANFFGLDNGAQIGLELRYGIRPGTQISFHRTSDRSIQLLGQQSVFTERDGHPLGVDVLATFEGTDNLHQQHQSTLGGIVSKRAGRVAVVYVEPLYVINSNPLPKDEVDHNDTFMIGLGARARVMETTYLFVEYTPRVSGYKPGPNQISFGVEKRVGGHLFQINFSDGYGTTFGQVARGGVSYDRWYLGFNISRKFF